MNYADTITYTTVLTGVQRAGFVAFPISPRNSPAAVAHLLTKTGAPYLVVGPEPALQELAVAAFDLLNEQGVPLPHRAPMPVFEDLYNDTPVEFLPPLHADLDDPTVMMHSSGMLSVVIWTRTRC